MNILPISDQARFIIQLLAEGQSVEAILQAHPELHGDDITDAAQECLRLDDHVRERIPKSGKTNLRTYEVWTEKEDALLVEMFSEEYSIQAMSATLERHPATVRRRIAHLGLE